MSNEFTRYAIFVDGGLNKVKSLDFTSNLSLERMKHAELKRYIGDRIHIGEGESVCVFPVNTSVTEPQFDLIEEMSTVIQVSH